MTSAQTKARACPLRFFVVYSQFVLLPAARDSVGRVPKLLSPHVMREPRAARPEVRTHRAHDFGRVPAGKGARTSN